MTEATSTPAQDFGSRGRRRITLLYVGTIVPALALIWFVLRAGSGLRAPEPSTDVKAPAGGGEAAHEVLWKLLIAITVIVVLARLVGLLFRRINQPQVMGEIVAGILLGPSLLGNVWPEASTFLFDDHVLPFVEVMAHIGLVLFMFLIGVELDPRLIRGKGEAAAVVSHVSILAPFLSGVLLALLIFSRLGSPEGEFLPFALFLGASMSVTAFPVLARILTEQNLARTQLGAVTLTCAAVGDLTAWCLLAVVVAISAGTGVASALTTIGLSVLFIAAVIVVVRPFLVRLAAYHEEHGELSATLLTLLLAGVLVSALATDRIGIHAIFGPFLLGAVMPHRSAFVHELSTKLEHFAVLLLLPLFFAYSGLRTQIGMLGTDTTLWLICVAVVVVAVAGKWGGSTLAARYVGLGWREANGLGVLMNCRGLTELVILNIGLDLGVIPPTLFAMLVIMALVTTFMTTPMLGRLFRGGQLPGAPPADGDEPEGAGDEEEVWRTLVHVANPEKGLELVHTALSLAESQRQPAEVVLLRVLELPDTLFQGTGLQGTGQQADRRVERALESLRPLIEFVEGAGVRAVPLVVRGRSPADAVRRVAEERRPSLVLLSWQRPLFGSGLLDGTVGDVLRHVDADVAVLVDTTGRGTILSPGGEVLVPYGGGYHEDAALELAQRLARTHSTGLRILGPAEDEGALAVATAAAESYERSAILAVPEAVEGDAVQAALQRAEAADLIVLAVSDDWAHDHRSLGRGRESLAARSSTPLLLVRRAGQRRRRGPRRWLRRPAEWLDGHSDDGDRPDGDGRRRELAARG